LARARRVVEHHTWAEDAFRLARDNLSL